MVSWIMNRFISKDADIRKERNICGYVCGGVGIFLNIVLFTLKLAAGIISSSVSITADAFNNLTDTGSSIVSLFGFILSSQKPDREHPFGHGRIEYVAGIAVSFAIVLVGGELLKSSVGKIINPTEFIFNKAVVIVLIISIAVKLYMACYNRKYGKKIDSPVMKAVATDSLSDAVATGAILLSSLIMHYGGVYIDGYVGVLVSLMIIKTGIFSVIEASSPLLGGVPDGEFVKKVEAIVRENPETLGIHDLVVHNYGPDKIFVSLHMEVDGSKEIFALHDAADTVERRISEELGCEAIIHMDPIDVNNPVLKEIYSVLSEKLSHICPEGNVHDLRIVPGPTHTNVIFDLILPPHIYPQRDKILSELQECIKSLDENYYAVITAEVSYLG